MIQVPRMVKKINHAHIVVQLWFHVIIQTHEMKVFPNDPHQAYMVVRRQDTNKCRIVWYDAKHLSFLQEYERFPPASPTQSISTKPCINSPYPKVLEYMLCNKAR
jgi:hypothetical protein